MKRIHNIHADCPFTAEEINDIKRTLYNVNAGNRCINPPHPSWYTAVAAPNLQSIREQRNKEMADLEQMKAVFGDTNETLNKLYDETKEYLKEMKDLV